MKLIFVMGVLFATLEPIYLVDNINRSFMIDNEKDVFLKDGEPFTFISGSLHYFRVPRAYWTDRLRKFRAAGLNTVCTYVEWSLHEPSPGEYRFEGEHDLEHFIQLAVEENLLVILRPGPYICAERDFGGFPPWLLTLHPDITLRNIDKDYQKEVAKWFGVLFNKMQKYLYGNGGPIIMVQVENEYGNFECNSDYKLWLRDEMRKYVSDAAVLFTVDNANEKALKCGAIPEVYATVDFGSGVSADGARQAFETMREFTEHGPPVNSEFYPGWLSHWQEPLPLVETSKILEVMKTMLDMKASFNFYMFFGGTNFGFTNGANFNNKYQPQLTSYDYDAPLSEAGDPTTKYYEIRDLISKYHKLPDIPKPIPAAKGNYGKVRLKAVLSVFDETHIEDKIVDSSERPKTFEEMKVAYGYMMYHHIVMGDTPDQSNLLIEELRDRIIVYINKERVGNLSRVDENKNSIPFAASSGQSLSILVENQGRINYGAHKLLKDSKGLLKPPQLNEKDLAVWRMTGLPFANISWIHRLSPSTNNINPPALYVGELVLPHSKMPVDTFVDMTGWGKGIIFVNDFNLGRYWPSAGPQVTLYVPGCYLRAGPNKIVVFETEYAPTDGEITFQCKPIPDNLITVSCGTGIEMPPTTTGKEPSTTGPSSGSASFSAFTYGTNIPKVLGMRLVLLLFYKFILGTAYI